MSLEDKVLAAHVRHAFAKTVLDISELNVSCRNGNVEITGKVKKPRNYNSGQPLHMRKELENIILLARNTRGVKSVYADKIQQVG